MPGAAHRRWWSAGAKIGCGTQPGIRCPVSCGHPKYRENATCVPGQGRCERPGGRRRSNSVPDCGARSRGVRGSPADRIRGEKKFFCCVTTRGRNCRVLNGLGHDSGLPPALLFGLGMLCSDAFVPTAFSLAASIPPAVDLPQAFRILAVALVPASGLVLASASFAKASAWARSPRSGPTAVFVSTVEGAHGSCNSQGKSSGRMFPHSPRALSKLEQDAYPTSLSSSREQDRETNGLINAPGTRNPSAAHQTIESAAGSEIGPTRYPLAPHRPHRTVCLRRRRAAPFPSALTPSISRMAASISRIANPWSRSTGPRSPSPSSKARAHRKSDRKSVV